MRVRKVILVLLLIAALGGGLWYQFVWKGSREASGDTVRVSGNIEVVDVEISFKIPGRIERRLVDEGDAVKKGQVLAILETADLRADLAVRQAELQLALANLKELENGSRPEEKAAAKATMDRARALLEELENGSRPQEIKVAEATLARAIFDRDRLKTELVRADELVKNHTIPQEVYDRQKANYDVSEAQVREARERLDLVKEGPRKEQIAQAREALRQSTSQYKLVMEGPREEVKEQSRARVQQAQAAVRVAQTRLDYATITSPSDGIVITKNAEPGEVVAAGTPVVTIADLKDIWLRAYLDYDAYQRVAIGQKARLSADGRPGKVYEGRVSFISPEAEFTPKSVQTQKERSKLVYRIKIDLDNDDMGLKRGMPADAVILLASPPTTMPVNDGKRS
jgi:HlyD family secretion protein